MAYGSLEVSYFENGAKAPAKPESTNNGNTRANIEKISGEEERNGEDKQEDTEKEDMFNKVLIARDLSSIQETTTGDHCKECKDTSKNKIEVRRHLMTTHRTMACESCKIVFKAWTDLKSHACEAHGNSRTDFSHENLQYSFKCEICGNSRTNEAHLKKHTGEYHRAKVKAPEEADNIKHGQRTTSPYGITEKTEVMKSGKELGE